MKTVTLLLAASGILNLFAASLEIHVGPNGRADAAGTKEAPKSFGAAVKELSRQFKKAGVPADGVEVLVHSGEYFFDQPFVLGSEFKGTKEKPIVIRAAGDGEVWFNGSKEISVDSFSAVTDADERKRLAKSAADKIVAATISDPRLIRKFKRKLMLNLTFNGQAYLPSVFPNSGYAKLKSDTVTPEVSPPAILDENVGYGVRAGRPPQQEPGKPFGWRGSLREPRGARVGFGSHESEMAGTWKQWESELKRDNTRNRLVGFIEANWLLSSQSLYAANESDQCIHLSRALAYGWNWKAKDKPFRVFGMLCELDQPGEWHFNPKTNRLFLYPAGPMNEESKIGLSLVDGFMNLNKSSHVSVIGLSVRNVGGGSIYRVTGSDNLVAACTLRDSTAAGVSVSGKRNTIRGCDLIDLSQHVGLSGGRRSSKQIIAGGNRVENCHIYQKNVRHRKVNISLGGVGNFFVGNLVHNSIGQAMMIRGNDHVIELNEFFNIGYEEGDGGAVYAGGDITGYGTTYRHNFFHHLMHVPGKVERSGIHLDDRQAGSICVGNVFYKSAAKGIHMNGGAGHTLRENVFLKGYLGAYNVGHGGQKNYDRQVSISRDPKSPHRYTKEDYVGRAERLVGKNGWNKAPWSTRYPLFRKVMNDSGQNGRMWPIHCVAENNFYFDNRYNSTVWSRCAPEVMAKVRIRDGAQIKAEDFENYEALDLRFKSDRFPKIPFGEIGLKLDQYRKAMPDKNHYRAKVKEFFKGIGSMPGTRKQIDTAELVETGPTLKL